VKTTCADVKQELIESDDGNYTQYTTTFANGAVITGQSSLGIQGDPFYLVYLEGQTQPSLFYNGVQYKLSSELRIGVR
jgi:hypothetical protein